MNMGTNAVSGRNFKTVAFQDIVRPVDRGCKVSSARFQPAEFAWRRATASRSIVAEATRATASHRAVPGVHIGVSR
jgi:hypothetical protein